MQLLHIIAIIAIISDCFLVGWLESVGSRVVYELDYKKPVLYVIPIQSILGKLPVVPVRDTGTVQWFRTACETPFRALPATAGRTQAMDAGCGSSTRGHLDGPVTCNKSHLHRVMPQGERFHVIMTHPHVWAMLPSALAVL